MWPDRKQFIAFSCVYVITAGSIPLLRAIKEKTFLNSRSFQIWTTGRIRKDNKFIYQAFSSKQIYVEAISNASLINCKGSSQPPMSVSSSYNVRRATTDDLVVIQQLIRDSFEAMVPHSVCLPSFWRGAADNLIKSELVYDRFSDIYLNPKSPENCFWVAEDGFAKVIGCVGIKNPTKLEVYDELELVRMG